MPHHSMTLTQNQKDKIPHLILSGMPIQTVAKMYRATCYDVWEIFLSYLTIHTAMTKHLTPLEREVYINLLTQLN